MKKRMILLLAAASIAASNPVITFAVVPDRVVGVGSSITVDEGDIVEINCSDLKHAGIYSLSEYDHDISKQMEKIASGQSSAFSNYDAAIAQIAARGKKDSNVSAGLEKEEKRTGIASKEELEHFASGKRTELNNGEDNPALQELRKLLEAAKAALEAAKKAKKNAGTLPDIPKDSTKINYDGGAANNAREGIKNAADAAKGIKGKAAGKDLHTYSGQGVHEFDNAQYTDDGIIITDSFGHVHRYEDGFYMIDADEDGDVAFLDAGLVISERLGEDGESSGEKYRTKAVVPAKRCCVCGSYYTQGMPCRCGQEGTPYEKETPKYLTPAPASYGEDGISHGVIGEYDRENDQVYFSLSGDDPKNADPQTLVSEENAAVSYECPFCKREIDPIAAYGSFLDEVLDTLGRMTLTGSLDVGKGDEDRAMDNPHMIVDRDGTWKQVCSDCYEDMEKSTEAGVRMDTDDAKAHRGILGTFYGYTGKAVSENGAEREIEADRVSRVLNGFYDENGNWHYYIDSCSTVSFVTACRIDDLKKGTDDSTPSVDADIDPEELPDEGDAEFDPGDYSLDPPDPDDGSNVDTSEIEEEIRKIEDEMDSVINRADNGDNHTDPNDLNNSGDNKKIIDEMSDAEKTIVDPNGEIDEGNEKAKEIAEEFHKKTVENGWQKYLDELLKKGVIKKGSSLEETIKSLDDYIRKNEQIHNAMQEDSSVRCQHITTTRLLNPETTIRHYVTKCTLYITDGSGKTVAEAQNWNGGSLYWAAQQNGTYTIVREVQVVDVVRSILVTQEKYSVANEKDGEPFYEHEVVTVEDGAAVKGAVKTEGSTVRAAPITVIVQRHNIDITVNGKAYPTERLW